MSTCVSALLCTRKNVAKAMLLLNTGKEQEGGGVTRRDCYNSVCTATPTSAKRAPFRLTLADRPSVAVPVGLSHCRALQKIHNRQYVFPYRTFKRYGAVCRTVCAACKDLGWRSMESGWRGACGRDRVSRYPPLPGASGRRRR